MSQQPRIIKKYPNRRLYDTETSSYITLQDVKKLVLEHIEFRVEDAKTKDDLTRSILLQIILEEESAGRADVLFRHALADHPLLRQRDAGHDGHVSGEEHPDVHRNSEEAAGPVAADLRAESDAQRRTRGATS